MRITNFISSLVATIYMIGIIDENDFFRLNELE